ncbi:protein SPIRAL1-like 5 [Cynara cardunculus var. scolymus]|uniref:Uncharacterized protein n=1 Tax=Cynara cardunculus var. scolymus TaxID=59895 RepID=A0A103XG98_CYNCS|nr:protein SPIRAL1-like 5 [Cynara cardunculus var. scolymus]KVH90134.1 hypothetical protein Ccrd_007871 [Cynara cardunculus var. scolymus]
MSGRRSSGRGQSSLGYLFGDSDELGPQGHDGSRVSSLPPVCHSGGGQSSLGYLFGSGELRQQSNQDSKVSSPQVCVPPYGTDDMEENSPEKSLAPSSKKDDQKPSPNSYIYHKVDSPNSRDFLMTARPSTRVTSVPGGDSSVGYLFGDK